MAWDHQNIGCLAWRDSISVQMTYSNALKILPAWETLVSGTEYMHALAAWATRLQPRLFWTSQVTFDWNASKKNHRWDQAKQILGLISAASINASCLYHTNHLNTSVNKETPRWAQLTCCKLRLHNIFHTMYPWVQIKAPLIWKETLLNRKWTQDKQQKRVN